MKIIDVFAIEPKSLAKWDEFRYVLEKFGFSQGRVLARYPKAWPKMLLDSIDSVGEIERLRFVEKLRKYRDDRMIGLGRNFESNLPWIENVENLGDRNLLKRCLISDATRDAKKLSYPTPAEVDEDFFSSRTEYRVMPSAESLVSPLVDLLPNSKSIRIIDPYFQVHKRNCMEVLSELVKAVASIAVPFEIFVFSSTDKSLPKDGKSSIEKFCSRSLGGLIWEDIKLSFIFVDDINFDINFHARYVLLEKVGFRYDKGFQASHSKSPVDISILDERLFQELLQEYRPDGTLKIHSTFEFRGT